jgi:hypothetical protein
MLIGREKKINKHMDFILFAHRFYFICLSSKLVSPINDGIMLPLTLPSDQTSSPVSLPRFRPRAIG